MYRCCINLTGLFSFFGKAVLTGCQLNLLGHQTARDQS